MPEPQKQNILQKQAALSSLHIGKATASRTWALHNNYIWLLFDLKFSLDQRLHLEEIAFKKVFFICIIVTPKNPGHGPGSHCFICFYKPITCSMAAWKGYRATLGKSCSKATSPVLPSLQRGTGITRSCCLHYKKLLYLESYENHRSMENWVRWQAMTRILQLV